MEAVEIVYMIMVLVVMSLLYFVGRTVWKSSKEGRDLGTPMLGYFHEQELFLSAGLTLVLVIVEASIASNFHPPGYKNMISPLVRVLTHSTLSMTSWVFLLNAPKNFYDAFGILILTRDPKLRAKAKKAHKKAGLTTQKKILIWVTTVLGLVIGLTLPGLNLYMLALGLQEDTQLILYFSKWVPWMSYTDIFESVPKEYWIERFKDVRPGYIPVAETYNPFADMSYPAMLMLITVSVTYAMAIHKGAKLLTLSNKKNSFLNPINPKSAAPSAPSTPAASAIDPILVSYRNLLEEFNDDYKGATGDTFMAGIETLFNSWNAAAKSNFSVQLGTLKSSLENIGVNNRNSSSAQFAGWRRDFDKLTKSSPQGGNGLGRTLKQ